MSADDNIGDRYQELTKYSPTRIWSGARPSRRPSPFKEYGGKQVPLEVELPHGSLWKSLGGRRSRRTFRGEPISRDDLARLVWAAQGTTARAGGTILRTAPSAGALYPVETYLVINRVVGIDPGVYHYSVEKTALELIKEGSFGKALSEAALGQGMCARAAAVFCWTAVVDRCKWKYAQRAYRYVYMDSGHICANVYLAAEDLGLGFCAMGAFYDDMINELLGVDGVSETAVYLGAAGPVDREKG